MALYRSTHLARMLLALAAAMALQAGPAVRPAEAAPSAPSNLSATVAGGQVSLTWSAPRGAVSYRLQRDGVRIASPTRPRYTDTLTSNGSYRYRVRAVDAGGALGPFSTTITVQVANLVSSTAPEALPPRVELRVGDTLGTSRVPVRVSWPEIAGAARYELQHRLDGGTWSPVEVAARSSSATVMLRPGSLNRFQVRVVTAAGAVGAWARGEPLWLAAVQDNDWRFEWTRDWSTQASDAAFGGSARSATAEGARAAVEVEGRQVAWIASVGPNRGRATIAIGGRTEAVDLESATAHERRIVHVEEWATDARRDVAVSVHGTAGRPRVDVDAMITLGAPPTAVLVGAGDIARCDVQYAADAAAATGDLVASMKGIVFTVGDNVQLDGTAAEFRDCYHPRWGKVRERTRPVPGNHDYRTPKATPYYDYFGALAGPRHKGWYAYDAGTWRIYALNSNCSDIGGCTTTSEQYRWLKADLAANPRRCVAAMWHHQSFSSGPRGSSSLMHDMYKLLYDNRVELLLSGHEHHYERFAPMNPAGARDTARGVRYFILGTGGTLLRSVGKPTPTTEALNDNTNGVLKLTLGWSSYSWQFVPVPGGAFGTFTDAGSGACH